MSEIWFTSRSHSNGCDKNNNYITDDPTKTYAKTIIDNNSITFYIKGCRNFQVIIFSTLLVKFFLGNAPHRVLIIN